MNWIMVRRVSMGPVMFRVLSYSMMCWVSILTLSCSSADTRSDKKGAALEVPAQASVLDVQPVALDDIHSDFENIDELTKIFAEAVTRTSGVSVVRRAILGESVEECSQVPCVFKNVDLYFKASVHLRVSIAQLGESYHCSVVLRQSAKILDRLQETHADLDELLKIAGWNAGKAVRDHFEAPTEE